MPIISARRGYSTYTSNVTFKLLAYVHSLVRFMIDLYKSVARGVFLKDLIYEYARDYFCMLVLSAPLYKYLSDLYNKKRLYVNDCLVLYM